MPINNKAMKNSFLGILVLSHVIISVVIGSEEESSNGKFHEGKHFFFVKLIYFFEIFTRRARKLKKVQAKKKLVKSNKSKNFFVKLYFWQF